MRVDLERIGRPVAPWIEHPPPEHHVPEPPHHAALAPELAPDRGRHLLVGGGPGLVDGTPAALSQLEGKADVLAAARVELDVRLAADRVDAPLPCGDSRQPRLHRAHRHLVAPVEALLVATLAALEANLAAGVADALVREAVHEATERVGPPVAVRVGEGEDLARRAPNGLIERRDLAAPRQVQDPIGPRGPGQLDRAVGGPVRGDDHLEQVGRVVKGARVGDLPLDDLFLVVRRDDQADARKGLRRLRRLTFLALAAPRITLAEERDQRAPPEWSAQTRLDD